MADKTAPKSQLRLEWVYGYRGHQCRNNLFYTNTKDIVYFVAGVGIVYSSREQKQRFFLGHDDDIISLALHPERTLVASGQVGKAPFICVWDTGSMQPISILKDGHEHGVAALAFDKDGTRLVSVGLDPHNTIVIWDWTRAKILATTRGHSDRILDAQFNIFEDNKIVTCGVKHIKFWTLCGNALSAKKGVFGSVGEMQTMLSLAFGPDSVTYAGTMSGDVYVWQGTNLQRVIQAAHKGAVYTLYMGEDGYCSGGKDGHVRLWDPDFKPLNTLDIGKSAAGYKGMCIRSVCWRTDRILVGTQDSEILEVGVRERDSPHCLVQGHAEGELWALAVHPTKPVFATGSDDQTLRIWSYNKKELVTSTTLDQKVRSCAFDRDGTHIAAGLTDGSFVVLLTRDLSEVVRIHDRKEVLHEMKFSSCSKYLAVASNDNFVDVYSTEQRYKRIGTCSGSSSFITHLDWSEDSKFLQTNSGAAERLFFKIPSCKQATNREEIQAIRWSTFTGVLGPEVNGIWEKYTDTNDVNAVDTHYQAEVAVTGDDFGLVKLFKFPSLKKGAKFRKYVGHSAHVTNVRFSHDKLHVLTTGGADHAVFQWRFLLDGADNDDEDIPDGVLAYPDSNSEDSDSDISDIGEVDSDLEREKQTSYDRAVYKEDTAALHKIQKDTVDGGLKRKKAPDVGLTLEFVHGYRGYDCRNNLFYTQSGEVIYHVAAVSVLYSREKHAQRLYLEHTDDILCLALHPVKDIVATGQVGRDPAIHVWDAESLKTLSILKGQHQRGVCAVDFSIDGKKLASVGLDDNHCIVVWDWRRGEKLATTRGHKDKIFVIKWNPFDSSKLVTVGVKHIKFWTQAGGGFTSKRGTFGTVAKLCDMLCVVYGKIAEICYSGGSDGCVFVWQGLTLQRVVKAHTGPCFAIHSLERGFVTGGRDGQVMLWDDAFERCLKTYSLKSSSLDIESRGRLMQDSPSIRAVVLGHGKILVGTRNGEILEVDKTGPVTLLTQGHSEGELWGLGMQPNSSICATVSDDKTLRIWDTSAEHRLLNIRSFKIPARCLDFSADGKYIAVGMKDGSFVVVRYENMEDVISFHHRKEEISDVKFSPEPGKYLAVGSHDNFVDIYNVLNKTRVGVCKGCSSYITHIDWDLQGKVLAVNSGAKELLFFEAPRGKRITMTTADIERHSWSSWTGVLGTLCSGIWPPESDVTDINAACLTRDRRILATADDFGFVKLFAYPAKGKFAKFKKYCGHSAHVTNVRWTYDNSKLVSVGGADTAMMVWSHGSGDRKATAVGEVEDDDDIDDDSGDGGYDSDVASDISRDYSGKIYMSPLRENTATKPHLQQKNTTQNKPLVSRNAPEPPKVQRSEVIPSAGGVKRKKPVNVSDLNLEHIFGYRGCDARMNLFYVNDGTDTVYHTAGAGIVMNIQTGVQSFYLSHTDDIISLTTNQHPKYKNLVATGQIGNPPCIHVWDAASKETLSILTGEHSRGVCVLDFSSTGKYLVSVGLEDDHKVVVWRWQEGCKVASAIGHSERIFHAEFRPDSDSHFVTVGVKHVKFWSVVGSEVVGKRGKITDVVASASAISKAIPTMLSVAFGANNITYTGSITGDVYVWCDNVLSRLVQKAHSGPIFAMFTTLRDGLIVTGAKELPSPESGAVKLWDQDMKRCRAFPITTQGNKPDIVRAVCRIKGKILVGLKNNSVMELLEKNGAVRALMNSHSEGELWGLTNHPTQNQCITASMDGKMLVWDLNTKVCLGHMLVGAARSVTYSSDGSHIAVGLHNGEVVLLSSKELKLVTKKRESSSPVTDLRFSPDGKYLAAGIASGAVHLYSLPASDTAISTSTSPASAVQLTKAGICSGLSGSVTSLDFSADSKHLKVACSTYESSVFTVPACSKVTSAPDVNQITWASWSSIVGDEVLGIWPKNSANGDVNCSHLSHMGSTLATGDDFGYVKLFPFPCPERYNAYKRFIGHSAHVTNVRFTYDDKYLISTGGDDNSVFVWKCL